MNFGNEFGVSPNCTSDEETIAATNISRTRTEFPPDDVYILNNARQENPSNGLPIFGVFLWNLRRFNNAAVERLAGFSGSVKDTGSHSPHIKDTVICGVNTQCNLSPVVTGKLVPYIITYPR